MEPQEKQPKLASAPEKTPTFDSLNPQEVARELAKRELESKHQRDKAKVVDASAATRAELLPTKPVQPEKPASTPSPTPEVKETQVLYQTSESATPEKVEATSPQPSAPANAASPSPAAEQPAEPEKKGFMQQIKDFFGQMWAPIGGFIDKISDWFKGLFKKKDSPSPTAQSTSSSSDSFQYASQPSSERTSYAPSENINNVIEQEAKRLNIDPAFAKAIITVEAGKRGINSDGSLRIRFEPHVFNGRLAKKGNKSSPAGWGESTLSGRHVAGVSCEGGQANEHACFRKALEIDREAAYDSISMGLGQIMGFNSKISGYSSSEEMYNKFSVNQGGEPEQIKAMFSLIEHSPKILDAARSKDFHKFTAAYNGSKEGSNLHERYVASMQRAYNNSGGGSGSAVA